MCTIINFFVLLQLIALKCADFCPRDMLKQSYIMICLCAALLMCDGMLYAAGRKNKSDGNDRKRFVLVLDAGHGGKDVGCHGDVAYEKNITLDVARRLQRMINDSLPDVSTVLTRGDDRYLTLQQRADIANDANGDLFISIHVNSVDRRSPGRSTVSGASVYVLGADKEQKTFDVARRENAVIELEKDFTTHYTGFDPSSAESYIIFELSSNMHLANSLKFADIAQTQLVTTAGRADKGVRQAGFWVLWATAMPAVLVELDFICNPKQEAFLNSADGRDDCAKALYNAFAGYYKTHNHQLTEYSIN